MESIKKTIKIWRIIILFIFPAIITAQPSLNSPVNGATGVSIQPTFQWSAGSTNEKLQISRKSNFSFTILEKNFTGNENSYSLTEAEKLDNDSTYYWRVSTDGGVTWSSVFSFTTTPLIPVTLSWPFNNTQVYTETTYFSWYAYSSSPIKFKVQVTSKTTGGNADWNQTPDFEGTTKGYYYVFNLLMGKTYYWRVIVLNNSNKVLSYSTDYKFTTTGGAEVPTLSYPANKDTVYYNPPTFAWFVQGAGTDITYDIQIDDNPAFTSPIVDTTNLSSIYFVPKSAFTAGTYYWHVESVNERGTTNEASSGWSVTDTFTIKSSVNLSAPIISYPAGGVTVYATSPYLYWYLTKPSNGISFEVWFKEDGVQNFTKANGTDITNMYYHLQGLTGGKTYKWYVVAKDGSNTRQSSTETFTVYQSISGTPVASYPRNGETVYSYTPTLYWYLNGSSSGFTKYTVRWKADNNSSDWSSDYDAQADITELNKTYYTFTTNLTYGKTYYWAVAAYDGTNYTNWSGGSFVIFGNSTVAPTLSYPVGGITVYSTSVTLTWYLNASSVGVQSYEVHYSNDGFNSNDVTISPDPTTNSVTLTGLTAGATYSWKVKTIYNNSLASNFSTTGTFTVAPGAGAVQPLPGSPNNVSVSSSSPTISWILPAKSESPLTYELQIAENPSFNNAKIFNGLATPFTNVKNLNVGKYYWRTRSKTETGNFSDYSSVAKFVVKGVTAVKKDKLAPDKFEVYQNYPNPFNPSTVIKFTLPVKENVTITIYNLLGQKIKLLLNRIMNTGTHKVEFNADNLVSGIYFYEVRAGKNTVVKKMILLK